MDKKTADKINKAYKPLADLLMQEHHLILTISEMQEIIHACSQVQKNWIKLNKNPKLNNIAFLGS